MQTKPPPSPCSSTTEDAAGMSYLMRHGMLRERLRDTMPASPVALVNSASCLVLKSAETGRPTSTVTPRCCAAASSSARAFFVRPVSCGGDGGSCGRGSASIASVDLRGARRQKLRSGRGGGAKGVRAKMLRRAGIRTAAPR